MSDYTMMVCTVCNKEKPLHQIEDKWYRLEVTLIDALRGPDCSAGNLMATFDTCSLKCMGKIPERLK